ncbi:hypothetical protein P7C70_g6269, partial [Phenoliferia sp. Uapishka_3]
MPSILLLGATGVSGLAFISAIAELQPSTKLTVLVRNRLRLPSGINARVVEGSLDSEATVETALEGVDTVVSFLGAYVSLKAFLTRDTTTPIGDAFRVVTRVMKRKGIKRVLVLSTTSAFQLPGETFTWGQWLIGLMPPFVVPQGNAEMRALALAVAEEDDFDYTIFRVPHLTEGGPDNKVWAGLMGPEYQGGIDLTRDSLVRWVLKEIAEGKWVRGAPALGNY